MKNKKVYEQNLEDTEEKKIIKTDEGTEILVTFQHYPNIVGPRSKYTGLPIWVGKTVASATLNGGTSHEVEAKCWTHEPFDFSQARVVSAGRLMKEFNLPTLLAEQVKD